MVDKKSQKSLDRLFGDAIALERIFKEDPSLVQLIIHNPGFLEILFANPSSFRLFLQIAPAHHNIDHLISTIGGDGADMPGRHRPHEIRLVALLRDPQSAAVLFREQPAVVEALLSNPSFAEQVKVRRPRIYKALLEKAAERFGNDPEMAVAIQSELAGIVDFSPEGGICETLDQRTRRENGSALLEAVKNGDWAAARLLIEKGANVDTKDEWQQTPMHFASRWGHLDTARVLVEKGADVNARDDVQATPLCLAAGKGHVDTARFLIENGANVHAKNNVQRTPLHFAALNGHTNFAALLIEKGADANAEDKWQKTPMHLADQHGRTDLAAMLKSAVKEQKSGHSGRVVKRRKRRGNDEPQIGS